MTNERFYFGCSIRFRVRDQISFTLQNQFSIIIAIRALCLIVLFQSFLNCQKIIHIQLMVLRISCIGLTKQILFLLIQIIMRQIRSAYHRYIYGKMQTFHSFASLNHILIQMWKTIPLFLSWCTCFHFLPCAKLCYYHKLQLWMYETQRIMSDGG